MGTPALDPKIQAEIRRLRKLVVNGLRLSVPEIAEELGVSQKVVSKYADPVPKDSPKTKAQIESSKSQTVYTDKEVAEYSGIDEKDVEPRHRSTYLSYLHTLENPASRSFGAAVNKLKKEVRRIFPDDHAQILKGINGKSASLEEILEHPLFEEKFGKLTKKAKKKGLKFDKRSNKNRKGTNKFVRNKDGSDALLGLKNDIIKVFPKPDIKFENQLKAFRDKGLSFDSKEIQDLIRTRGNRNLQSLRARANVWSWDTVNGLPDGDIVPGTKKKVANLFFGDPAEEKAIRELYHRLTSARVKEFYKTGHLPNVDHVDHIFPQGNARVVNGQLLGGSFDEAGRFMGVGVSNRENLRKLAASQNMALGEVLSPDRIKLLESLENANAASVAETQKGLDNRTNKQAINDTLKRINQLGEFQRGRGTMPKFRWGGAALSVPLSIFFGGLMGSRSGKSWGAATKDAAMNPWLYADALTQIDTKRTIENPSRLFSPQTVIYQDIIEPTAQMAAQGLRSRDPTEDEYAEAASMGSPQGLLGEGHPGLQDRSPMDTYGGRRRKNIWN